MEDLIDWLRVQADADELVAKAAAVTLGWDPGPGTGSWLSEGGNVYDWDEVADGRHVVADEGVPSPEQAIHIALWDPKRALAELAAKRLRLDEIQRELGDDPANETAQWQARVEALPYAGRLGFRDEWRLQR